MPKVKFSEISELSPEELSTRLRELKAEGLTLRLQQAT
jgi:ribosomal protein L29